ncbi:Large-conductance mechanosensitive channel [Pirellulimonas nuda]|uniref:Large-conductance mechanosensitive channel n=1 Tax=Pirellulimonas nuda TaxID=2528009 RepID=A0A518DI38_9BACT|nr:large-conductance mechanosensitive channel protein MscL [Pirellulimonas nuda]QDU91150.1 Large-conductance mechanosensitive channel [Pirellulimonas nuda]
MGLLKEFRAFAMRGNVVDLAVGVVIGAAFGKIVSSLVANIVMPVVGLITSGKSVESLKVTFKLPEGVAEGVEPVTIQYGLFLQSVIDFVIIAFAIFLVVKAINTMQNRFLAAPEANEDAPPPEEIQLLREIRDALKKP